MSEIVDNNYSFSLLGHEEMFAFQISFQTAFSKCCVKRDISGLGISTYFK